MSADVIRVSMPFVELAIIAGAAFIAGFAVGLWTRWT